MKVNIKRNKKIIPLLFFVILQSSNTIAFGNQPDPPEFHPNLENIEYVDTEILVEDIQDDTLGLGTKDIAIDANDNIFTLGDTSYDYGYNIGIDNTRDYIYIAGAVGSALDMNPDPFQEDIKANGGAYLAKFDMTGEYLWSNVYATTVNYGFVAVKESTGIVYYSALVSSGTIDFVLNGKYQLESLDTDLYIENSSKLVFKGKENGVSEIKPNIVIRSNSTRP